LPKQKIFFISRNGDKYFWIYASKNKWRISFEAFSFGIYFFFLAMRKWMKFLKFRNGSNKREKKAIKTSMAEDIGFTELKITKVFIQSELFAYAWKLTWVNVSRAFSHSQCVFTFQYADSIRTDRQIKYGDSKYLCDCISI